MQAVALDELGDARQRAGRACGLTPQRCTAARQPRDLRVVAEAGSAVHLVRDAEHDARGVECGDSQRQGVDEGTGLRGRNAPQCVTRELVDPGALHLGLGEHELHALEVADRLAELFAGARVGAGEIDGAIEHPEQGPTGQRDRHLVGRGVAGRRDALGHGHRRRTPTGGVTHRRRGLEFVGTVGATLHR